MKNPLKSIYYRYVEFILSLLLLTSFVVVSYTYLDGYINNKVDVIQVNPGIAPGNSKNNASKGVRTSKINVRYDLPKDIQGEVEYKDVKFISTVTRPFSETEIQILKSIIDNLPQKLFDYRPWAIISTSFESEDISRSNPEGVAFSSGPYIFVGDVTFKKQASFDTGTYRGLTRIISHEIAHNAQFFETRSIPTEYEESFLENSSLVQDWVSVTGWVKNGQNWYLPSDQKTTEYGRSNPVEDMADAIGSLIIGEEYNLSNERIDWVLEWLGATKEEILVGTLPLSSTLKQRKVDAGDGKLIDKYKDVSSISQDVLNFQSSQSISRRDFANFYATEFKKRGWSGTINTLGVGEFIYQNKFKVNIEMDNNPLRVSSLVLTVY